VTGSTSQPSRSSRVHLVGRHGAASDRNDRWRPLARVVDEFRRVLGVEDGFADIDERLVELALVELGALFIDGEVETIDERRNLIDAVLRRRGCVVARVNTHTFQAPGFYEGLGYSPVGRALDTPVGYEEVFFERRLVADS
jgi:hypothetical protein